VQGRVIGYNLMALQLSFSGFSVVGGPKSEPCCYYIMETRSPYTARRQQRWLCSMVLGRLKREEEVLSVLNTGGSDGRASASVSCDMALAASDSVETLGLLYEKFEVSILYPVFRIVHTSSLPVQVFRKFPTHRASHLESSSSSPNLPPKPRAYFSGRNIKAFWSKEHSVSLP
jgi:hypothetical protein